MKTADQETPDMADATTILPEDAGKALLVGRVHVPGAGPTPVLLRDGDLYDLSGVMPTMAHLLNLDGLPSLLAASFPRLASLDEALAAAPVMTPGSTCSPRSTCRPSRPPASPSPAV